MIIRLAKLNILIITLLAVSLPLFAAKKPLRIVSLSYSGKCVSADTVITVNLNKKITRGYSLIAITGKGVHNHPQIIKWPFRANSIKVLLPPRSVLKRKRHYSISIERRVPHKTLSNKKSFRVCRK